jgi:hypothetical protein
MTRQTDLECGIWRLEHYALDDQPWARAVLDELHRLQKQDRAAADVDAWLDTESSLYAQRYLYETIHESPAEPVDP